jgi:GT2 family glycosyltransferase
MKITAIIPVFNRKQTTLNCLGQIHDIKLPGHDLEIVIVDDGSTDGTPDAINELFPEVTVLREKGDLWWTGAINAGVEYALKQESNGILLLNDDLIFRADFLTNLFDVVNDHPNTLVSAIKLDESEEGRDQIINAGFRISGRLNEVTNPYQGLYYPELKLSDVIKADILTGATIFIPAAVFHKIGLFDAASFPHNWGDFEFTQRATLAGFQCLVASKCIIYTEYNRNYGRFYFKESTRVQYLRNLFDVNRFGYGYRFLMRKSYMHRSSFKGTILFLRGSLTLTLRVLKKIILPNSMLK